MNSVSLETGKSEKEMPSKVWKILTMVGIFLAVVAVIVSVISLSFILLDKQPTAATNDDDIHSEASRELQKPMRTNKENEKLVSDILHKKHFNSGENRDRRSISSCSSDYSDEQTDKNKTIPTAHITGTAGFKQFIFEGNKVQIVSDGWLCNHKFTKAHVAGGMSFANGFLKVPTAGVYFIYSQVSMKVKNSSETSPVVMGHNTMICQCSNEDELDESCECYSEEGSRQLTAVKNRAILGSMSVGIGNIEGAHFHGGLFQLNANSYISIIPVVMSHDNPKTEVYAAYTNSFYGAFLVSH